VIHQPVSVVSQCGAGAWLNGLAREISADLREAVAHQRCVCNDALYKSTITYYLYTYLCCKQYVIECRLDEVWRDYIFDLVAVMPLTLPPTHARLRDCYRRLVTVFRQSAAKSVPCFSSVTACCVHKYQVNKPDSTIKQSSRHRAVMMTSFVSVFVTLKK